MRPFAAVAVTLGALLALSGCGSPGTTSQTVTPATSRPPTTVTGPATLVAAPCASLAPATQVSAVYGPAVGPADTTPQSWVGIPEKALRQAGGTSCGWTDGAGNSLTIDVFPHADAAWEAASHLMSNTNAAGERVTTNPVFGDASFLECTSDAIAAVPACSYDIRASGYWVHLDVVGATAVASPARDALARTATAAIVTAGAPGTAWAPPRGSRIAPETCTGLLSLAQARTATTDPALTEQFDLLATLYPQQFGAIVAAGGMYCSWLHDPEAGDGVDGSAVRNAVPSGGTMTVTVLDGGSWAWDGRTAPPNTDPTLEFSRVAVTGGTGWGACSPTEYICLVDVIAGGSWIEVQVDSDGTSTVGPLFPVASSVIAALR